MKLRLILFFTTFVTAFTEVSAGAFSPDTLSFSFSLYGQTRRFDMKFESKGDSLALRWQTARHGNLYKGGYTMGRQSLENGSRLCFLQPEWKQDIAVPRDETAFIISRSALRCLRDSAYFIYGNTRYDLVDNLSCAPGVPSLHVVDRLEGCRMWIVDDMRLPLIWRMSGNPLGIDWTIGNVEQAFARADGGLSIAFISDPHVQDVERRPELARTLSSELMSTRLFNENVFAFRAALDDVARRGIRLVVLPGDLTDDGQIANVNAVKNILDGYSRHYGMMFFVTTGNHDPARPYGCDNECGDFLAADGSAFAMASSTDVATAGVRVDTTLHCCGYGELMRAWAGFGYSPRREYIYWATPFSTYVYDGYSYERATEAARTERRRYTLCDTLQAIDASYVVEPCDGLWLLAIDGGVYLPEGHDGGIVKYKGSSTGYANVMGHKRFLLDWIARVADEARRRGKILVAFCHYPAADFHDGAAPLITKCLGPKAMNIGRRPPRELTETLLKAGIKLHFAGHIHQNNTAVVTDSAGNRMYNVQVPSTAAYFPAYKILDIYGRDSFRIRTVTLDTVAGFRTLWPRYIAEYARNRAEGKPSWSADILYADDYATFCDMHFRNLVKSRYIPREMPAVVGDSIINMTGSRIMTLAFGGDGWRENAADTLAWTGLDLVTDIYRLHFGGSLAMRQIPAKRLGQYRMLMKALNRTNPSPTETTECIRNLCLMLKAFIGHPGNNIKR